MLFAIFYFHSLSQVPLKTRILQNINDPPEVQHEAWQTSGKTNPTSAFANPISTWITRDHIEDKKKESSRVYTCNQVLETFPFPPLDTQPSLHPNPPLSPHFFTLDSFRKCLQNPSLLLLRRPQTLHFSLDHLLILLIRERESLSFGRRSRVPRTRRRST